MNMLPYSSVLSVVKKINVEPLYIYDNRTHIEHTTSNLTVHYIAITVLKVILSGVGIHLDKGLKFLRRAYVL